MKVTLLLVLFLLVSSLAYSADPCTSWDILEASSEFRDLDYDDRLACRIGYFRECIAIELEFKKLEQTEKMNSCLGWVNKLLTDEEMKDLDKRNEKIRKKRDKCINKVAEKSRTEVGFKASRRICRRTHQPIGKQLYIKKYRKFSKIDRSVYDEQLCYRAIGKADPATK